MSDWINKAKDFIKGHPGQAQEGIDKVEGLINEKTGGTYADQLEKGGDALQEQLGLPPEADEATQPPVPPSEPSAPDALTQPSPPVPPSEPSAPDAPAEPSPPAPGNDPSAPEGPSSPGDAGATPREPELPPPGQEDIILGEGPASS